MIPDRLSIPSLSNDSPQPARSSSSARDQAPFASLYAEALQFAQQAIAEPGSVDTGDAPGDDDLLGFLELRASCFPGGSVLGLNGGLAGGNELTISSGRVSPVPASRGEAAGQSGEVCSSPGISRIIDWLDSHAQLHSTHRCAASVREAMEAAGIPTADRPGDAGDYGPFLLRHGAQVVAPDNYQPRAGDIAVFNKSPAHPSGHVQVFDGEHWVSDFLQHSFSPYRDQQSTPPVTVYRIS